jgi:hypothetical protein
MGVLWLVQGQRVRDMLNKPARAEAASNSETGALMGSGGVVQPVKSYGSAEATTFASVDTA